MATQRHTLVAPLNWGLGHATRCIPIIQELLRQNHHVFLASDGRALNLLRAEFPTLPTFELPAYNVTYRTTNMFWNIGWQLPKIAWAIQKERKVVKKIAAENNIDIIISDNRFGAFTQFTHNIFLTHQLHLKIPFRPFSIVANWCNHYFIRQFDECWIPDFANEKESLAGTLAHPPLPSIPTHYLGALSRFAKKETSKEKNTAFQHDIFVLLSGPEPQRTYLEKSLISQLRSGNWRTIIVQGKTEQKESYFIYNRIKVVSYLTTSEIETVANASKLLICRSGYSTIMDLYYLRQNAFLIPTSGQTEQEYLAQVLKKKGIFYSKNQGNFDLETALRRINLYRGFQNKRQENTLKKVINQLVSIS